jgi:hypothetical protein
MKFTVLQNVFFVRKIATPSFESDFYKDKKMDFLIEIW